MFDFIDRRRRRYKNDVDKIKWLQQDENFDMDPLLQYEIEIFIRMFLKVQCIAWDKTIQFPKTQTADQI